MANDKLGNLVRWLSKSGHKKEAADIISIYKEATLKIKMSPLEVAVALGLLSQEALPDDSETGDRKERSRSKKKDEEEKDAIENLLEKLREFDLEKEAAEKKELTGTIPPEYKEQIADMVRSGDPSLIEQARELAAAAFDAPLDLSGADLSKANLVGVDFSGLNLSGADLRGALLSRANLTDANLTGADLRKTILYEANWYGANFTDADLRGTGFLSNVVPYTNLSGANFSNSNLKNADFYKSNLSGANLSGAHLEGASFIGADLNRANLTGARIGGANFRGADLRGADLSDADSFNYKVYYFESKYDDLTKWPFRSFSPEDHGAIKEASEPTEEEIEQNAAEAILLRKLSKLLTHLDGLGQKEAAKELSELIEKEAAKKKKKKKKKKSKKKKRTPTKPELWQRAIAAAKRKFDVYPSAYANGWALQWYKKKGGGWRGPKPKK